MFNYIALNLYVAISEKETDKYLDFKMFDLFRFFFFTINSFLNSNWNCHQNSKYFETEYCNI